METPSSARRVTRSQTLAANSNTNIPRKMEDFEMGLSKSKEKTGKQDRSALIDITNDSPIVGLANGNLNETPISSVSKQSKINWCKKTPGSGEALLRGQVKTLLQRVEEEAEISKFSMESRNKNLKAFLNSPAGLLAPTPANTPQVLNFSEFESLGSSVSESPIEDKMIISQEPESESESEKDLISRSLFLDFIEKSDSSSDCSSIVTYLGTVSNQKKSPSMEEDDASTWSIQVNASTIDEDEDENENQVIEDDDVEEDEDYDDEFLDELCEEMSKISVNGNKKEEKFMGKHVRFEYNSDDELVEVHEEFGDANILRLEGLPTPKGKHLRFQDDEDE